MTRESEKSKIRMSVIVDGKHINSLKKADKAIDQIFDYFGEQLQDKDDEIELLKCRIEEAMKPKTCEGCKHYSKFKFFGDVKSTQYCHENGFSIRHIDFSKFCCNRYKPKDNA